ncbi:MAG: haloacid dehalogenase [Phormidesmis sp.]
MANQIILTALEGMGLQSNEDYDALRLAIAQLNARDIPVIVFTDRDRAEIEPIRQQLGLTSPFITECGSGIFTPVEHNPFDPALGELDNNYYVEVLGCPYVQARAGLRVLANEISHPLKGFGDFTVAQMERSAGLMEAAAHRAKDREFSEPFMTPKAVDSQTLRQAAEEMGFDLVLRQPEEGRFSYLIGAGAGIQTATQAIIAAYQNRVPLDETLSVLGISHRAEDLTALADASNFVSWTGVLIEDLRVSSWLDAVNPLLE